MNTRRQERKFNPPRAARRNATRDSQPEAYAARMHHFDWIIRMGDMVGLTGLWLAIDGIAFDRSPVKK